MYELCSNLVFIILYILLDDEASIDANHSWVNISFSFWLQALTNKVLFVKHCEYQIPPKPSEHIRFLRLPSGDNLRSFSSTSSFILAQNDIILH